MFSEQDHYWQQKALALAKKAASVGEVPIGAVVVLANEMIGEGYNKSISQHDPTAHAEIIALREAAHTIGNYRLINTRLYVTLEPCLMCANAMVHARVEQLIYGTHDLRAGAVSSQIQSLDQLFLNHRVKYAMGLMQDECAKVLKDFFKTRRK